MFASRARSKRPNFSSRKSQKAQSARWRSFLSATSIILVGALGRASLAQYVADQGRLSNGVIRFIDRTAYEIPNLDPVLTAILGGLAGMVLLVYFIRDYH